MLILNIADIHFHHPFCNTNMDEDKAYRTKLVADVKKMTKELSRSVDAILVCGDIAFAGKSEEYDAAYEWLISLADASKCQPSMIFVVPGNHDVDRVKAKDTSVQNVHHKIKSTTLSKRKTELYSQFSHPEAGRALFKPLEAYNEFAARFNCQVFSPERLFWQTGYKTDTLNLFPDFELEHGIKLRLFGLNSTLLSGFNGNNDERLSLYLSPLQTVFDPEEGVVNALICHHPPDWLEDIDEIEDAVCGRVSLQFFGHKHRQRVHRDFNFIRFSSGAVNPEKSEGTWEPGYNLVNLKVVPFKDKLVLEVEAHMRVWQTNPDRFVSKMQSFDDDEKVLRHRLPIQWSEHVPAVVAVPAVTSVEHCQTGGTATSVASSEEPMDEINPRSIVLRFWGLKQSERREIAKKLGLITDADLSVPEAERYGRAFIKAHEQGLLKKLDDEIRERELKK